jgi:hypothetical protein
VDEHEWDDQDEDTDDYGEIDAVVDEGILRDGVLIPLSEELVNPLFQQRDN